MRAFILYSKSQVNSFVKSGVLADVASNSSLQVLVKDQDLTQGKYPSLSTKDLPGLNPLIPRISGLVQMCALWKYKDRSMNHTVRAYASFGSKNQRRDWTCVVVSEMKVNLFKRLGIRMLSRSPFFELLKWIESVARTLLIRKKTLNQFRSYSALLIPFSGHIGIEFGTYIWIAKKLGIKSVAIQENWDNLSTKTFLTEEPDCFFVWGKQSEGHVRAIHKMRDTRITVIGSPRFSTYYSGNFSDPVVALPDGRKITISKPFVLIGGTGDGIDDEVLLSTTFVALSDYMGEIEVVYRPHPMSRTPHNLRELESKYPSLLIDAGEGAGDFGHQIPLVQNCFVLLNHFSTLTLEGLIAGTQVAVPLFLGRETAVYKYRDIFNEWHHMSGISFLANLHLPANPEEFALSLRDSFHRRNEPRKPEDIEW
ncbi:MAG TPA: hypothetical protein DIT91_02930, partial [Actinobacteria bacterium]|nr:hypothetical protein [Actinomycetota bacterium]